MGGGGGGGGGWGGVGGGVGGLELRAMHNPARRSKCAQITSIKK